jgi:IS30 family transposase
MCRTACPGAVQRPDGSAVAGPEVRWIGRRHGRRKDRRWGKSWSPEQTSNRLRLEFPDDESMRVSHEAIYQSPYVQGRGALRQELTACLRTGRALRVPRVRARRGKSFVTDQVVISERPAEAVDRAVPGHWEGDLILGLESSAIGTLVERGTRFTMLLHLPPMTDQGPRVKNGPALAGHGAEAVRDAIAEAITTLPEQLRRSLAWDQGTEMAQHAQLRIQTGLPVYFCDPHSPSQRGTNENTNGLLRQYFPKGTDLARHTAEDLDAVAATLNSRPRNTLHWRTPAEALHEYLSAAARTGAPASSINHQSTAKSALATGGDRSARTRLSPLRPAPRGEPPRRQPRHHQVRHSREVQSHEQPLLRGPVEAEQFVSLAFGQAAGNAGIARSMGSRGDCYDKELVSHCTSLG